MNKIGRNPQIRAYQTEDNVFLKKLLQNTDLFSMSGCELDSRDILVRMKHSMLSAGKDIFIGFTGNSCFSGFALLDYEPPLQRGVLTVYVAPDARRSGLGSMLVDKAVKRGRELGAVMMHVCLSEEADHGDFFIRRGFKPVRKLLDMCLSLNPSWEIPTPSGGLSVFAFSEGDESRLADLQNRIFKGSWGFSTNQSKEIHYYLELTRTRIQDIILFKDGERIAGYAWAHSKSGREGRGIFRIHMCGLLPEYRGKGVGRNMLEVVLIRLHGSGARGIDLTVDAENHPAVRLYKSYGFEIISNRIWYECRL